ncbi:hypothetical protein [Flaviramulus basaltis]|nr:hypothetical protein [Flaviramulus basaltis]
MAYSWRRCFYNFIISFLVTKYTKYGGGSHYGMTGEFDDNFIDYRDDFD